MIQRVGSPADADAAEAVRIREREFHDALTAPMEAAVMPPRQPDHLEAALLARIGLIRGRDVLEMGCGTGDLTLELARAGARVTACDLSPRTVDIARQRLELFAPGAPASFLDCPVEKTGLPTGSFDLVVGKWILHHADIAAGAAEIHRLLRPGGRAVFIENSGLNPLLRVARERLAGRFGIPRYGTEDEHPLVRSDYRLYRELFSALALEFPDFCFLQLLDRQLLKFRRPRVTRALRGADHLVWRRLRPARRYSYHVLLDATR